MEPLLYKNMHEVIPLRTLTDAELEALNAERKLSLSLDDMRAIRDQFKGIDRDPTDVELEVLAQTWSEHCKHRIFNAVIHHACDDREEVIDGIFPTHIRRMTEKLMERKPDFVLSAFHDNAGFIRLDDRLAVGLKVETHNHPSAIEPYAGSNTGLGGVLRDILGAGKGARPVASLDVFCLGNPDTDPASLDDESVIHPLGILRGVVRGVRDYGNRMGIPTIAGAIHFDDGYCFNPLVFCGTAGVLPIDQIEKQVEPGYRILVLGGRTGRDGLRGATFSSASLDAQSREEDQGAVQIGNPIEEKKAADCLLHAREQGLIECVTDCGAGGLSSAVGEMGAEHGASIELDRVPLKEPGLTGWEIFLSESQERMVLAVKPQNVDRMYELAELYETECVEIGTINQDGCLRVRHHGEEICCLDCDFLHTAPRKTLVSTFRHAAEPEAGRGPRSAESIQPGRQDAGGSGGPALPGSPEPDWAADLHAVLRHFNMSSREPIIREYDHEVLGNTLSKPLAGPGGDGPADATVFGVDGSERCVALGLSVLPAYHADPFRMAQATVDETIRQLVVAGADPDRVALLDNFCLGTPEDPDVLGELVETVKGMSEAARLCGAPFISGKDSFYNCYETDDGTQSIPPTLLVSGLGVIENKKDITGAVIRKTDSNICLLGLSRPEMGGSIYARIIGAQGGEVPSWNADRAMTSYRLLHTAIRNGWILSAHDASEGGLAAALAEMGFSLRAGIDVRLEAVPVEDDPSPAEILFAESTGRILFEVPSEHLDSVTGHFRDVPFAVLGSTCAAPLHLTIRHGERKILDESLETLKESWKNGLTPYY